MSVDRLSVTVPSDIGAALRALADARGTTVSTIVSQAIGHEIRLAALDRALAEADSRFGALAEGLVLQAEVELARNARSARPKRRRRAA
jgi:predicted transcriptional regulator